jgi:hypothetical protein
LRLRPVVSSTEEITAMASARMPKAFFETVADHRPPEQPAGPKGGRPRIGHRVVIRVIARPATDQAAAWIGDSVTG